MKATLFQRKEVYLGLSWIFIAQGILLGNHSGVTLTETVYQNAVGAIAGVYSRTQEYGDQIILGGDSRHILSFSFEYRGQFESEGDETCILRFYANDGDSLVVNEVETSPPGTLLFESDPFTIFPDYNTATVTDINVDVPISFTWTVEFGGLRGISSDRAGLVLRNPPNIGLSFDDIWVKAANGWAPFRFNGNPVANFAALAVGEKDISLAFIERYDHGAEPPTLTLQGPRDQTVIIYASDDFKTWIPLAHDQLNGLTLTLSDPGFTPRVQRFYRATFANSTLMSISNLNLQTEGSAKMAITGPSGQPFTLQATPDFEQWRNILSFSFPTRPMNVSDPGIEDQGMQFYRLILSEVTVEDTVFTDQAIATYPTDFTPPPTD